MLWTGKGSDVLPTNARDLGALAHLGGGDDDGAAFGGRYLRVTRQARQVFEQRFYGL